MIRCRKQLVSVWHLRVIFIALLFFTPHVLSQSSQQEQLQQLQAELKARQASLAKNQASADELQSILKQSEIEIGAVAKALNLTQSSLQSNKAEQSRLTQRQSELTTAIKQQQQLLAGQLKSAFMAGHYDYAKMFFYQDDAASFERVLTYYQYINRARQDSIATFKTSVEELIQVSAQLETKQQELVALLQDQTMQRQELVARQEDRRTTLASLSRKIATEAAKVEALQANEKALMQAIEQAQLAAQRQAELAEQAEVVLTGLSAQKGHLGAPASGRVRKLFGKRRQGEVRWKGIIIEGNEGNAIKVVSRGRVLYADWLKGFGLVTIVDHGDGYMSVYGHSQALLKQVGDMVVEGETIALVGQSGGQSYPNLYFEIRHKGKALNPSRWLAI